MYAKDMPKIARHGMASPDGLVDVVTFVLLTIQQPFPMVARQFADVKERGEASPYLFGAKRDGYRYVKAHKEVLFAAVKRAKEVGDCVGAVDVLTVIPSLGMVKAAFVAQCLGFEAACLDMHNLNRLGMKAAEVKLPKTLKAETRRAKIARYVEFCRETGGARYWWDTWCAYVAGRRNSPLKTAAEVSAFHYRAIGLA
jgi:hypothetical protein